MSLLCAQNRKRKDTPDDGDLFRHFCVPGLQCTVHLQEEITAWTALRIRCFSGCGGEVRTRMGRWGVISREAANGRLRDGKAQVLLRTDAASEESE